MKLTFVSFLLIVATACGTSLKAPDGKTFGAPGQSSQAVAVACTTWQECMRADYAECGEVSGTTTLVCLYQPCTVGGAACPTDRPVCDSTVGYCRKNVVDSTLPPGFASCVNNAACGTGLSCYVMAADSSGTCYTENDPIPCIAQPSAYVNLCAYTGIAFMGDPACTDKKWRPMVDGGACVSFN